MKLLAVSEHYFPRVGGTVNYVHETLCALAARGVEAELWVPGPRGQVWLPEGMEVPPYTVRWLDSGYPLIGDPSREQRYEFCRQVNSRVNERLECSERPDLVHVLFGLFVMEVLLTERLRGSGVPCVSTVHNVPPLECGQVAHTASSWARFKESLRLRVVLTKNHSRLRRHAYDRYIVPSDQVRELLLPIVGERIEVIGHGQTGDLRLRMCPPVTRRPEGPLRLLTVGGYAPHKRQHLIPETAAYLRDVGIDFIWEVAGPSGRVRGYFADIAREVAERSLGGRVVLNQALPLADLARLYDRAHLYVQPTVEEGFCLTALDAAGAGLPVIGCRAGALQEIIDLSGGLLVQSAAKPLAEAIIRYVHGDDWGDAAARARSVAERFSWPGAADTLLEVYEELCRPAKPLPDNGYVDV